MWKLREVLVKIGKCKGPEARLHLAPAENGWCATVAGWGQKTTVAIKVKDSDGLGQGEGRGWSRQAWGVRKESDDFGRTSQSGKSCG